MSVSIRLKNNYATFLRFVFLTSEIGAKTVPNSHFRFWTMDSESIEFQMVPTEDKMLEKNLNLARLPILLQLAAALLKCFRCHRASIPVQSGNSEGA